ncbi:MAG: bifunctional 4-hydroxy-3-methylbut-2-enyl diphosphate reductase/30S ribosomal protein S1 [Clostridia bacterium]|nr:bifunctional 4-hydroxy-3-methylbut-2-enyl diphosphate reductase/30S ribosomal protein S1 [Clostridia bacterium]
MIVVGKYAGFCPGVRRAVEKAEELASAGGSSICTLGMLIHNVTTVRDLKNKGVSVIGEEDLERVFKAARQGEKQTVILRAHGVTRDLSLRLEEMAAACPDFAVEDCTCPYVKKIHRIVEENTSPECALFVFGNAEHPEVKGICSYAKGGYTVVSSESDLEKCAPFPKNAVFVAQTTQNEEEWKKCQKIFKNLCTNGKIFDTICNVTESRQKEVKEISAQVDAMLVIGSRESSNTMKLYDLAKKNCRCVLLTEDGSDIDKLPADVTKLGITAGASTPDRIIEEVHSKMNENFENFEQMLNESFRTLNTGDTVDGVIISVSPNELTVDTGTKFTGVVPFDEVAEDSGTDLAEVYKVGDRITARAIRVSDVEGVATLSVKQAERTNSFKKLSAAYENGEVLTGKVTDVVKGGVIVTSKYNRVFIPAGQTGVPKEGDLNELKGKTVRFKIIVLEAEKNRAVGSIRVVEREERKANLEEFWANIEVGKTYTGKVKSLTSFGAFVDLGGIDGMIHMTELSWGKIKHPSDVVSIGEEVTVFVKGFDREKKRISLGYKKAEDDPWVIFTGRYAVGDVAPVKIVSFMPFGAFAEVLPGVDGLIHISQIADKRVGKPEEELQIGQIVDAKIVGIDEEKKKISLSIRALLAPAADEAPADETPADAEPAADEAPKGDSEE